MRGAAAIAAMAVALTAAGCGDRPPSDSDGAPSQTSEGGSLSSQTNLQTASCRNWRSASSAERRLTVERLAEVVAGPRGEGSTLPRAVAYRTLEGRCRPEFAQGFLLYELYIRAAGFYSLADQAG